MNENRKKAHNQRANGFADSARNRFAILASSGELVFHAGDFANLWRIGNKNTLYTTLSRYVSSGNLFRVYKGLYAIKKSNDINTRYLALKALHSFGYISCESVLFDNGIINQPPPELTIVSSVSKHFQVVSTTVRVRKMDDRFLFNNAGIELTDGVKRATVPRAVADMLYFNPKKYLDAGNPALVDWNAVKDIIKTVGYAVKIPQHTL